MIENQGQKQIKQIQELDQNLAKIEQQKAERQAKENKDVQQQENLLLDSGRNKLEICIMTHEQRAQVLQVCLFYYYLLFGSFILLSKTLTRKFKHKYNPSRYKLLNDYTINKCDQNYPALKQYCYEKKQCMNRDPYLEAQSLIGIQLAADTLNGFISRLDTKTLVVITVFYFGTLICIVLNFRSTSKDIKKD